MDLYDGPIRGGTRGGAAEFKWTDVSADKDRENYLGHSINAPTGRWQKNQDVHWYTRDGNDTALQRAEEIRRIKVAEADILAIQLGFKPAPKAGEITNVPVTAIPLPPEESVLPDADVIGEAEQRVAREDKARRKEEKRARKEEKRERKERRRAERDHRRSRSRDRERTSHRDSRWSRSRSRSPARVRSTDTHRPRHTYDRSAVNRERDSDRPRRDDSRRREQPGQSRRGRSP